MDQIYSPQTELNKRPGTGFPKLLRFFAHVFSVIFHPLLISSYVIAFLAFLHPAAFAGFDIRVKLFRMTTVFLFTFAFPAFTLFLAWRLKLIASLHLYTMQDRIVGYIITMFFYWWTWNVFKNLPDSPPVTVHFLFGTFLAVCGGWMCNIFFKISMHAIAMGGLMAFFWLFSFHDYYASGLYLSVAILIAGLVCTARLIISDHSYFQIITGFLIGLLSQYIAWLL